MNQANETFVTSKMLEEMRKLDIADGYTEVPNFMQVDAERLLKDKDLASMDKASKRKIRMHAKRMRREGVPGY